MNRAIRSIGTVVFTVVSAYAIQGQEIHIRVLDGRNGRPITNECVNVWIGEKSVESFVIPTNKDGIVFLQLTNDDRQVRSQKGPACGGLGVIQPVVRYSETIRITADYYMPCQAHPPDTPWLSFSIAEILRSGVTASNACGKIEGSPERGELVFFVRPLTWWEKMWR
jgi:hypothetical protein